MSNHHTASSAYPVLSHTATAREATPVDATPTVGSNKSHLRPNPPCAPSPTGFNDEPRDYFRSSDVIGSSSKKSGASARSESDLRDGQASPNLPEMSPSIKGAPSTEIRAGLVQKSFHITSELLVANSPYFAEMQNSFIHPNPPHRLAGPFFFPDLDEFAVAYFVRWLYGAKLHGPHDFHSMNHHLGLYVLAQRFRIERLKNTVMDLIRAYYCHENMTAPAFRLDYIYGNTETPCLMREFLVTTAAYRALHETGHGISDSIRNVLRRGGDVAPDFAFALVRLVQNGYEDVRKGDPCHWHEHDSSPRCEPFSGLEPFQTP